jgi:hypothetical protein
VNFITEIYNMVILFEKLPSISIREETKILRQKGTGGD